jgi:hypothetical protein
MAGLLSGYAKADNAAGSGPLLGIVSQHISHLEGAALTARNGLRDETFRVCSRFAEFAGWLCQDGGDLHEAEHWTQRALDYLEAGGDQAERAYVLMRKSAVAAERKDVTRSVSLAVAAEQATGGQQPRLAALVLRQAAISYALANDEKSSERAAVLAQPVEVYGAGSSGCLWTVAASTWVCTPAAGLPARRGLSGSVGE